MQMVQAGQNYAKLGGQYTKEMRFPHGKVSDFVLRPTPSDESNIWFQANISPFTHLFKQSKPEQEKSNQSETEHLVLSKELINVIWPPTKLETSTFRIPVRWPIHIYQLL